MGRPKGSKKDKFADLDGGFKDAAAGMDSGEIVARIAQIALNQVELEKAKKEDEDLANLKEQVKMANEPYSDGAKMNDLKIQFYKRVLEDQGKEAGEYDPEANNKPAKPADLN